MSIVDNKMPELDPTVWYMRNGSYQVRPEVEGKIKRIARKLLVGVRAKRAYIVGSITGYYYRPTSDIDVTIVVKADDELFLALKENAKKLNGQLAPGTQHPINFYVMQEKPDFARFDGVYDLRRHKWLKNPTEYGVDLYAIYDDFRDRVSNIDTTVAEVWRSLIDIDLLREALRHGGAKEVAYKLRRRIDDLDEAVDELATTYDEAYQDRVRAFKRQLDLAEMGQSPYPSANLVPENIWYKLLERYHYLNFLQELHRLVEQTGKIDTKQDIHGVREIMQPSAQKNVGEGLLTSAIEKWRTYDALRSR